MEKRLIVKIENAMNCRLPRGKREQSRIFQFVDRVRDFSSHYGNDSGVSYTAYNVIGHPSVFPEIGDDSKTYSMKTYGPWWKNVPSSKLVKFVSVIPTCCMVLSQDFIEVEFRTPVYPCVLNIYETYNPGALIKVLCYCYEKKQWKILWSDKPKFVKLNSSKAFMATMVQLNWVPFKTDLYRLEFYHHHLDYYYELDAIELGGYESAPYDENAIDKTINPNLKNFITIESNDNISTQSGDGDICFFTKMPDVVQRLIFSYLDLETLCIAAKVSRLFKSLCYDSVLYNEINLQPFWHKVTSSTLLGLQSRCTSLKKLSLTWCGNHDRICPTVFSKFIEESCQFLTCLKLSKCQFLKDSSLVAISKTCRHLEVLELNSCNNQELTQAGYSHLPHLKNLVYLDISYSNVDLESLFRIVWSCLHLEHLLLNGCKHILNCNILIDEISKHLRNLKTLELFRLKGINAASVVKLAENCRELIELDLGWCINIDVSSGCLQLLAKNCNHLKKLYLTSIRSVSDDELECIAEHCKDLEQLDILGSYSLTAVGVERVLLSCKKLKLLDISYCSKINRNWYDKLCSEFPKVQIKKVCGPV